LTPSPQTRILPAEAPTAVPLRGDFQRMARRRFQKGSLVPATGLPRNGLWIGRWREDVLQDDGTIRRPYKWEVLGSIKDYPTRRLAQRALEARLSTINDLTYRARPTATLKQFADRWEAAVLSQHKPSTRSGDSSRLRKRLIPYFGSYAVKDVSAEVVQRFVSQASGSPKTVKNCVALLRVMWNSARAWGYVAHDPFDGLVLPRRGLARMFTFSLEETRRILNSAGEPYRTFYAILAETGIRGGEICALRVSDLDLDGAVIYVRQSVWRGEIQTVKSSKGNRRFPISPALVEQFRAYLRTWHPNPLSLLFATRNGTPWDHALVRKRKLHPLLRKLGIQQCGFHAFRHGNATLLDQIGAPMAVRQNRLGHADAQTTMGYTHLVTQDERRIAELLGEILHGNERSTDKNGTAYAAPPQRIQ